MFSVEIMICRSRISGALCIEKLSNLKKSVAQEGPMPCFSFWKFHRFQLDFGGILTPKWARFCCCKRRWKHPQAQTGLQRHSQGESKTTCELNMKPKWSKNPPGRPPKIHSKWCHNDPHDVIIMLVSLRYNNEDIGNNVQTEKPPSFWWKFCAAFF